MQQFYQKKNKNGCIYMYRSTANQKEYCSTREIKKKICDEKRRIFFRQKLHST